MAYTNFTVDTAGSGVFPAAQISFLDADEARELAGRLAREAARRARHDPRHPA